MIFYLSIKTDRKLTHIPQIDAIDITLDGVKKHCTWDETDACLETRNDEHYVDYRFKGISYDENGDEHYANGTVKETSIVEISKDFSWKEDDDAEEFDFDITWFTISDYDEEKRKEVILGVVQKEYRPSKELIVTMTVSMEMYEHESEKEAIERFHEEFSTEKFTTMCDTTVYNYEVERKTPTDEQHRLLYQDEMRNAASCLEFLMQVVKENLEVSDTLTEIESVLEDSEQSLYFLQQQSKW